MRIRKVWIIGYLGRGYFQAKNVLLKLEKKQFVQLYIEKVHDMAEQNVCSMICIEKRYCNSVF